MICIDAGEEHHCQEEQEFGGILAKPIEMHVL
jgi:hypothetical protein